MTLAKFGLKASCILHTGRDGPLGPAVCPVAGAVRVTEEWGNGSDSRRMGRKEVYHAMNAMGALINMKNSRQWGTVRLAPWQYPRDNSDTQWRDREECRCASSGPNLAKCIAKGRQL